VLVAAARDRGGTNAWAMAKVTCRTIAGGPNPSPINLA
jgi:hypothetical protein